MRPSASVSIIERVGADAVFVSVIQTVIIRVVVERVGADGVFVAVGETVVVGVFVEGVRADVELVAIRQAVVVGVVIEQVEPMSTSSPSERPSSSVSGSSRSVPTRSSRRHR